MKNKRKILLWTAVLALAAACFIGTVSGCTPQPNQQDGSSDEDTAHATPAAWSMDSDCGSCHTTEQDSSSDSSCLASTHAAQATCTTCHTDESTLATVHENATADGKMPTRLKKTEVTSDTCLSCHDDADRVTATAGSTVCTDSEGTTVNPHDLPVNDDHKTIECADCHSMHAGDSADEQAPEVCLSCHHADVYQCGTCHS